MKKVIFVMTFVTTAVGLTPLASAASWSRQSTSVVITQNGSTTSSSSTTDSTGASDTLRQCLQYQGHLYEVCTAYIVNSQLGALVPYYKYAHSGNISAGKVVSDHLEKRYTGQARQVIVNRVRSWPITKYDVAVPNIRIISAKSNLAANSATLVTQESWQVRSNDGQLIYQENNARHIITLQRVPSYVLHKWVVSAIN